MIDYWQVKVKEEALYGQEVYLENALYHSKVIWCSAISVIRV
jgi:hypothetical protein